MTNNKHDREDEPEIISNRRIDSDEEAIEESLRLESAEEVDEEVPLTIKRKRPDAEEEEFGPIDYFDGDGEVVGSISSDPITTFPGHDELSCTLAMLIESLDNVYEDELERAMKELGEVGLRAINAIPALLGVRRRVMFDSNHPDDWRYYAKQFDNALVKITGRESSRWTQVAQQLRVLPEDWPATDTVLKPGVLDNLPEMNIDIQESGNARPCRSTSKAPMYDTLVFDNGQCRSALEKICSEMGVAKDEKRYAAFLRINRPGHPRGKFSRYLVQMRLVTEAALQNIFLLPSDTVHDALLKQRLSIGEALNTFVEDQIGVFWPGLELIPEDIVWARLHLHGWSHREGLGFGFFVENHEAGIYRIWSRMWMNQDWQNED